jgi:formate hydrogenlyase transcriptional activator
MNPNVFTTGDIRSPVGAWLLENGPRELDLLFRAIVFQYRSQREVTGERSSEPEPDCALLLLDPDGRIALWQAGAPRIYGYTEEEAIGQDLSFVHLSKDLANHKLLEDRLKTSATTGHHATEGWQVKKNGAQFWANVITLSLKDEAGKVEGFATVVRDFTRRHETSEKIKLAMARLRPVRAVTTIAGIASGGLNSGGLNLIPEINDALLEMVGYSRKDLEAGLLNWTRLTPAEFFAVDERAHEEGLMFGACTPFEKQLIRKDGTRVPVMVATAILKLAPFRWISFVQDLRERDRIETVDPGELAPDQRFGEMVGSSDALRRVQLSIDLVAPTDANVLILGETGTGKELVARAIHRLSPRAKLPFITLNCAAIPTGLLESELFGYERGAFTGALAQKIGRFEMAHRGTLFLDEVGDIPIDLQPKLLRALQEKSFERLGGTRTIPIDVRLVAATNRNLTQMMGDKLFRSDLYYRLKVFPINTPPLREHAEDIPILVRHFINKYAGKMGRKIDTVPTDTMHALVEWPWPGNVRELENFMERSVILSRGPVLRAPLAEIRSSEAADKGDSTLEYVERAHIIHVLRECAGVVTKAATRLGLHRTTLNAMMRRLGITRGDF